VGSPPSSPNADLGLVRVDREVALLDPLTVAADEPVRRAKDQKLAFDLEGQDPSLRSPAPVV
jgi:hypothetical protein